MVTRFFFVFVFADPAEALRNAQQLRTSDKVRTGADNNWPTRH